MASKYTRRQKFTCAVLCLIALLNAICYAIQAPFYPALAESKGVSPSQYGFVFGVYQLTIFIASPIFGYFINSIGPKFMIVAGVFLTGSSSIIFGMLIFIEKEKPFVILSFCTRIVEAIGAAGSITASFTVVATEFPDSVGSSMASIQTFVGVGLIIGPTVGGVLFQLGGFTLPFVTVGCILLACCIIISACLPNIQSDVDIGNRISIFKILKRPAISLAMYGAAAAAYTIGFMQALLEPHLRVFNLSPVLLGLVFVIPGGTHALLAPVWGKLCDMDVISTRLLSMFGACMFIIAFLFIGPAPFIPVKITLWLILLTLFLTGIGIGGELIPGFSGSHKDAHEANFPQDLTTLGSISGLFTSSVALGEFIGPSVTGVLVENFGFEYSSLSCVALHVLVALLNLVYFLFEQRTIDNCHSTLTLIGENTDGSGYGSCDNTDV